MTLLHSEVLNNFPDWEVLPAMPSWERRGLSHHSQGEKFVRARGEEDWCNGFFVALLGKVLHQKKHERQGERKESDFSEELVGSVKKKKKKSKVKEYECSDMEPVDSYDQKEVESGVKQKKKKKKVKSEESDGDSRTSHSEEIKKKKKKKSKD